MVSAAVTASRSVSESMGFFLGKEKAPVTVVTRARGGLVVWVRVNLKQFIQLPVDEPSPLAGKPLPDELSEIVRSAGFQDRDLLVTKRHWGACPGTSL